MKTANGNPSLFCEKLLVSILSLRCVGAAKEGYTETQGLSLSLSRKQLLSAENGKIPDATPA